jgi:hypothetical protein
MNFFTPKRDGMLAIGLVTLALATALGYLYLGAWRQTPATAASPLPALPDIQVPDDAAVKEMATLGKRLNRLAYPHATGSRQVALGLFGYTPAVTGLRGKSGQSAGRLTPVQFDYTLSFALAAGRKRLCLLDGQLYTKGAVLPDGGRILAIEPERVLIEKAPLQRWVYLQDPQLGRESPTEAHGPEPLTDEEL